MLEVRSERVEVRGERLSMSYHTPHAHLSGPCTAHPHASLTPFQLCLHMSLRFLQYSSSTYTHDQNMPTHIPMHLLIDSLPCRTCHEHLSPALHTHTQMSCPPRSPPPGAPACPCCVACACHTRFQDTRNRCIPEHIPMHLPIDALSSTVLHETDCLNHR